MRNQLSNNNYQHKLAVLASFNASHDASSNSNNDNNKADKENVGATIPNCPSSGLKTNFGKINSLPGLRKRTGARGKRLSVLKKRLCPPSEEKPALPSPQFLDDCHHSHRAVDTSPLLTKWPWESCEQKLALPSPQLLQDCHHSHRAVDTSPLLTTWPWESCEENTSLLSPQFLDDCHHSHHAFNASPPPMTWPWESSIASSRTTQTTPLPPPTSNLYLDDFGSFDVSESFDDVDIQDTMFHQAMLASIIVHSPLMRRGKSAKADADETEDIKTAATASDVNDSTASIESMNFCPIHIGSFCSTDEIGNIGDFDDDTIDALIQLDISSTEDASGTDTYIYQSWSASRHQICNS